MRCIAWQHFAVALWPKKAVNVALIAVSVLRVAVRGDDETNGISCKKKHLR